MEDAVDRGLPFYVGDPWQRPIHLESLTEKSHIFGPLDTTLPRTDLSHSHDVPHFDFRLEVDGVLHQQDALRIPLEDFEQLPSTLEEPASNAEQQCFGLWEPNDASQDAVEPRLLTWEGFEGQHETDASEPAFLSECGPAAFDFALNLLAPKNDAGVFPQDYTLRCLSNLVLGRSSTLFAWNEEKCMFEQTVEGASISGISTSCANSLIAGLRETGTMLFKMRRHAQQPRPTHAQRSALVALQSCASTIVDAVEAGISERLSSVQSILQLQQSVEQPRRLLGSLQDVIESAEDCDSEEDIVSQVADRIYILSQNAHDLCPVFRIVLARISGPWLDRLAADVGLARPAMTGADSATAVDDNSRHPTEAVSCIDVADAQQILETKLLVCTLRALAPDHPLVAGTHSVSQDSFSSITRSLPSESETVLVAKQYEDDVLERFRREGRRVPSVNASYSPFEEATKSPWDMREMQESIWAHDERLVSDNLNDHSGEQVDPLYDGVRDFCRSMPGSLIAAISEQIDSSRFTPLRPIKPLLQTQNRLVNGAMLRQLFQQHALRKHLNLQRSFQLLGSGSFVTRLGTALFSTDVQSAERRRGIVPTSAAMGLRLGASHEEQWPPASSELQLTLMHVLTEAWQSQHERQTRASETSTVTPGSLSFAIRELPESEIERVLDPDSIYALDFLRLQYTAAPPLTMIFTTEALDHYDNVFRLLLKLLRALHITNNLQRKCFDVRRQQVQSGVLTFAHEAHHFVTTLSTHFTDVGIAAPWSCMMRNVESFEQAIHEEDQRGEVGTLLTVGVDGLRQLHDRCLDDIRARLFLKRKQEKVRSAIETVLTAILKAVFTGQSRSESGSASFRQRCQEFQRAVKQLCSLLHEQADRPPKRAAHSEAEETEMCRMLLTKLNWNGFYLDELR